MVSLDIQYQADLPETGENFEGYGTLKDFSLSGLFFFSDPPIPLLPGQILTLNIAASLPYLDHCNTSHIQAKGKVVRLEATAVNRYQLGIAITFLEGPTFSNPARLDS